MISGSSVERVVDTGRARRMTCDIWRITVRATRSSTPPTAAAGRSRTLSVSRPPVPLKTSTFHRLLVNILALAEHLRIVLLRVEQPPVIDAADATFSFADTFTHTLRIEATSHGVKVKPRARRRGGDFHAGRRCTGCRIRPAGAGEPPRVHRAAARRSAAGSVLASDALRWCADGEDGGFARLVLTCLPRGKRVLT